MAKLHIYLIALLTWLAVYGAESSTHGAITGGVIALVIIGIPFAFDLFKEKLNKEGLLAVTIGFVIALGSFGLFFPVIKSLGTVVTWGVFGALSSVVSYVFYITYKDGMFQTTGIKKNELKSDIAGGEHLPKILDTSIVIDGRIIDLASTGFIEGDLIVPSFVLREIQLISDSADSLKRNRGRRGLEMLNALQKRADLEVKISYVDYPDTREVDAKLVRLAKDMGGKLITNDFNLNKVAELQDVEVLNINNLANALKPVVLPGEDMEVQVVKEGKDENQGIGYLEDGTMVVIENGGKLLGKKLKVGVTSVIQTNAGKMIFTKVASKN